MEPKLIFLVVWSTVGICVWFMCAPHLDGEPQIMGTFCVYIAVVIVMVCVIFVPKGSFGEECKAAAGTYCPPGYGSVLPCPMGYTCARGRLIESCPPKSTSSSQRNDQADCICDAGYSGDAGKGTCTACAAGKYKSAAGNVNCTDCGAGKFRVETGGSDEASCTACGAGKYGVATGQTAEALCTCNAGWTGPAGGTCTACGAGRYKTSEGTSTCIECPAGESE
jgi:hypothetical protein